MGSWWAFCIQKEGLEFGQKMKGIFGLILYEPSWARKRRLYYLWLLSGASKPSQGFSPFLEGESIFFRKKRKPCLSPHARGFLFCVSNIIGGPGFWNLAFFYETTGSTQKIKQSKWCKNADTAENEPLQWCRNIRAVNTKRGSESLSGHELPE